MASPNHDNDQGSSHHEEHLSAASTPPTHHRHRPSPIIPPCNHHHRPTSSNCSSPRPPPPTTPPQSQPMPPPYYNHPTQYMLPYMHIPTNFPMLPPSHVDYPPRPWNTGLFDCCEDVEGCIFTLLCPCISFPKIIEIINEGQTPWWEHAIIDTWLTFGTGGISALYSIWLYRKKMRQNYNLKGDDLKDCLISNCCPDCVICQLQRQLVSYGYNVSAGWKANMEKLQANIERQQLLELAAIRCQPPEVPQGMSR